ncbi:endonuclease/exonuclease/phosphatase family protein, partial [Myxococcota bacterium]|nr:endonuclease/exonuclease/phosphatase family protein [Myxococcota bacterium]
MAASLVVAFFQEAPSAFSGLILSGLRWPVAALALLALLVVTLRRRKHWQVALGFVAVLLSASNLGGTTKSVLSKAEGEPLQISILSFNILFRGGDRSRSVAVIKERNADIVLLQEVTPGWERRLRKIPGYPYKEFRSHRGTHGLAILSRFPLSRVSYLPNRHGRAIAQCANIKTAKTTLALCNVHTASPAITLRHLRGFARAYERNAAQRQRQWTKIARHLRKRKAQVKIVAGDFNTLETEPLYSEITTEYVDVFRQHNLGLGTTFPHLVPWLPFPLVRIDYIFVRGAIEPLSARVISSGGSDHS